MKPSQNPTVTELARDYRRGVRRPCDLVEELFATIDQQGGRHGQIFTLLTRERAQAEAEAAERRLAAGDPSPLLGIPISVKDLFDVAGETTTAGTVAMRGDPPATADAPVVARLAAAGAVLIGRTNMTELAYSGIGHNPHYDTPHNPADPARVPGGSSSGAAPAVARGLSVVSIGTDTGGSVRIPASFCGVTGFKPSKPTVSTKGAVALSSTLDSIGPLANSVADCRMAWAVMADQPDAMLIAPAGTDGLSFVAPTNFVRDDCESTVLAAFDATLEALSRAGIHIEHAHLPFLDAYADYPAWQMAAVESSAIHADLIARASAQIDQRVIARMNRAQTLGAVEYEHTRQLRYAMIEQLDRDTAGRTLIMPTTPIIAPRFDEVADAEGFTPLNVLSLRNTTIFNALDGCAISLPMPRMTTPAGVMLARCGGQDLRLLSEAETVEAVLNGGY